MLSITSNITRHINLKHAIYTKPVINRNHTHHVSDGELRRLQVLNRFILKNEENKMILMNGQIEKSDKCKIK